MTTLTISKDNGVRSDVVTAATIGHFDGVHLGHQHVLRRLIAVAKEKGFDHTMAITFDRHPRTLFDKSYVPNMLTTVEERQQLISLCGIDQCAVLQFDKPMAAYSACDFMKEILYDRLGVRLLLLGYDNHFGKREPGEGFEDYRRYGEEIGIEVVPCDGITMPDGRHYSSTMVRKLLADGHCQQAIECLGRPYTMHGTVVEGFHEGRKLGFPTANLSIDPLKVIPVGGVYAVRVRVEGFPETFNGMMNIGHRPTYGINGLTLETNIFHFDADIYGKEMTVALYKKMREEHRFSSVMGLALQLKADAMEAEDYLNEIVKSEE